MMVYKYRLTDPDSGKVLYEGTAADLAAQGVVRAEKILPTLWRDQQRQHKRRGKHRWDITREKVEVACSRKAYKVRLKPKKTAAVQAKPPKRPAKPKAGRRGAGDGGRCGSGTVRERRQRMSKDKCRMSRKRFCKKAAGKHGVQVQEVRDMVREEWADPLKRLQEKRASAKHRAGKQEGSAV